jgi:hypothetical protein
LFWKISVEEALNILPHALREDSTLSQPLAAGSIGAGDMIDEEYREDITSNPGVAISGLAFDRLVAIVQTMVKLGITPSTIVFAEHGRGIFVCPPSITLSACGEFMTAQL